MKHLKLLQLWQSRNVVSIFGIDGSGNATVTPCSKRKRVEDADEKVVFVRDLRDEPWPRILNMDSKWLICFTIFICILQSVVAPKPTIDAWPMEYCMSCWEKFCPGMPYGMWFTCRICLQFCIVAWGYAKGFDEPCYGYILWYKAEDKSRTLWWVSCSLEKGSIQWHF